MYIGRYILVGTDKNISLVLAPAKYRYSYLYTYLCLIELPKISVK